MSRPDAIRFHARKAIAAPFVCPFFNGSRKVNEHFVQMGIERTPTLLDPPQRVVNLLRDPSPLTSSVPFMRIHLEVTLEVG